ncbi:hypothetical protein SAMN05192558_112165 [Actinokineospora alba]|uniref:Uncharacterized protein n=1 Tax=Actinokineospora alba TaxID=504798 RepID=A0A1H0V045_9PSEU|nr:hypothetical protein [Actinokineospora alba]TDP68965.1 hypothetical protein C8E96_4535 [Actinokineospora alba]SDI76340.1 hypothetical protein SAMN05421871_107239 [Actinokineospora alba]SDP71476.1 hypothetical protein SAMN05192558_112165 [Actinokineospora alba]
MNLVDRAIAPGATRQEVLAGFGAALAGAVLALSLALDAHLPALSVAVVAVVAFDLFGGAVVNATDAAKRWYHGPGRTARHHLTFVALHIQPYLLAWTVPGVAWTAAAAIHGSALVGAVLVTVAPAPVRRPVAFAVTAFALTLTTSVVTLPPELGWFAPLLLIKLLLAHLLPEVASR